MGVRLPPLMATAMALAVLMNSPPTFAHGGGLNSQGCHNNRKTGDYHCHRTASDSPAPSKALSSDSPAPSETHSVAQPFRSCAMARAAGAAPVRRGDPGYGSHLDRDNDGVGCE